MTDPIEVLHDHTPYDYLGPDSDSVTGEKWGYVPEYLEALAAVVRLRDAARDLHERVEMDESVGICISSRVESLRLGAALAPFNQEER